MNRPTALWRSLACVGLVAAFAAVAWAVAEAGGHDDLPDWRGPRYQYGQLVVDGQTVVLVQTRVVQRIEIPLQPTDVGTIFSNSIGKFERRFNPLFYGLDILGAQGWEIVGEKIPADGDRILVRRVVR